MSKMYEAPVAEVVSLRWEESICLSGGGTENVGIKTELNDDDFE